MSEDSNHKSIFSQIIIGVAITVIGAIVLDMIRTNSSDEPPSQKRESKSENPVPNRSDNSSPSDDQSGRQQSSASTQPNSQNYYPETKTKKPKEVDYTSYVNNSLSKSNVSVIIVDANGNISTPASSAIASIYQKTGKSTSIGLIRSAFIKKPEFQELCEGNSEIIQKLNLSSYADYIAIGRINYSTRPGKLVNETIVCSASISMNIISTNKQSLEKSFTISNANGNGADDSQAREDALQKLLDRYYNDHSSL